MNITKFIFKKKISNKNPKKLKTDSLRGVIVNIQTSQAMTYGTFVEDDLFFIDLQGKKHLNKKLNRIFSIGDVFVLFKDISEKCFYKGYCCAIIGVNGTRDGEISYDIEFNSNFSGEDISRRSQKQHPNFEFPSSNYTTILLGKDLVRLVTQDLYYKTCF